MFLLSSVSSHRYVQSSQSAEVPYSTFTSLPPAGLEEPNQVELLLMENERLRQELETHREKTGRIQKVRGAKACYYVADISNSSVEGVQAPKLKLDWQNFTFHKSFLQHPQLSF